MGNETFPLNIDNPGALLFMQAYLHIYSRLVLSVILIKVNLYVTFAMLSMMLTKSICILAFVS